MPENTKLFRDACRAVELWRVWTFLGVQDIKSRFRRSFVGPLWILLNMAFFVGGAGVVYGLMFGQPMRDFLPFLTLGFVIWGFILSSFTEAGTAFVNAEGYIKQFSYPKQIYLMRALIGYLVIFLIGLSALIPLQFFFERFMLIGWLMAIPGLLLLALAALGHITICAYVGTRFRDLPHALGGILQVLFFVTPIMFPIKVLKERHLDFVYQYNPLYYLIDIVRHPILEGSFAPAQNYLFAAAYIVAVWVAAIIVARALDNRVVFLL
jgi:ABC-type polysaccharide/polyol phosphate export permease